MSPILDQNTMEIFSRSSEQTRRIGMRLGPLIQPGNVICLAGDLGSGKTTMVQGLAAGWGSLDTVSSPSFVLVNMYRRADAQTFYHLDAYRLNDPQEAVELDIDEMLYRGSLVVEWADRIEAALPSERLWISFRWIGDMKRNLLITASGKSYQSLLVSFRQRVYGGP
jgi:tRNA threonylcarbamoyladenosine biosynthesis protein TsaE